MNGDRIVILRLYKSLRKLAKRFDQAPAAKALIYRHTNEVNTKSQSSKYYSDLLDNVLKDKQMLNPSDGMILGDIVKEQFRKPILDESLKLTHKIDTAFAANRKLSSLWKCYLSFQPELNIVSKASIPNGAISFKRDLMSTESKFEFDSASVDSSRCINKLPTFSLWDENVRSGVVLMAHPMLQGQLGRSLVLLLEHGSEGSYGVVINKPDAHNLKSAVHNLPSNIQNAFSSCWLSYGGPVRRLQYLHRNADCAGAMSIPLSEYPLFAGGSTDDSIQSLEKKTSSQRDYSFYAGCCTWAPNQLQTELVRGLWIPVDTQADLAVSLSNYAVSQKDRDDLRIQAFSLGRVQEIKKNPSGSQQVKPVSHKEDHDEHHDLYSDKFDENDFWFGNVSSHKVQQDHSANIPSVQSVDTQQVAAEELTRLRAPLLTREHSGMPFRVDVYQFALNSLGPVFEGLAALARSPSVSVGSVESCDWK